MSGRPAEQLYHGLTNVREDFIEEAQQEMLKSTTVKRKRKRGFLPVAACLVLILGTISVFAAAELGVRLFQKHSSSEESGYDIAVEIERKPMSHMSEDVREISNQIVEQFRTYEPYCNQYAGSWDQEFPSPAEAVEFIGLRELEMPDLGLEEDRTTVSVLGNPDGKIQQVSLCAEYHKGKIRVQSVAEVYTEHSAVPSIHTGISAMEEIEFTQRYYTTSHDISCLVMAGTPMKTGRVFQTGYLVKDGILYSLHISCEEENRQQVESLLRQWADSF